MLCYPVILIELVYVLVHNLVFISLCPATASEGGAFMTPPPLRAANRRRGLNYAL